jgi:hypothetical protein
MPNVLRSLAADATLPDLLDHYAPVETPRHPDAITLLAYWRGCVDAGDGFLIGRDIPARPIANLLRSLIVNEPLADGSDMMIRLAGAMVRRRFGGDIKGHLMSEIFPPRDFASHRASAFAAIRTGHPIIVDSSLKRGGVEELHTEALLLPVTARDRKSIWLLVGVFYFD